jgi:WD40 repeat protein
MEKAGGVVDCPSCGRHARLPPPKSVPAAPPPPPPPEEEEIKLQELNYPPSAAPAQAPPMVLAVPKAKAPVTDDDGAYGLDASDGLADLDPGTGMYGTFAVIRLDEPAGCIAYGCKGDWALAGQSTEVAVINMKTKKNLGSFDEHCGDVTSVALSATVPLAVSADEDGEILHWEISKGKPKRKIRAHDGAVNAVALSPNAQLAASGGEDGCIYAWELATGKRRRLEHADWNENDEEVTFVTFSRDGTKILAGGSGGRVAMWEVETGKRIKRFAGLDLPINCLRLSDEGGKITATTHPLRAGGVNYVVICHWDTKSGKPMNRFNIGVESSSCCVAPDRGGARILIAGGGAYPWMGIWSLENGRGLHGFEDLRGSPTSLAVSPMNNRVLAALDVDRLQLFGLEPH